MRAGDADAGIRCALAGSFLLMPAAVGLPSGGEVIAVGRLSGPCVYLPAMATAGARRHAQMDSPPARGWAMLTVPSVAGAVLGGLSGWDAVLLPAWLLAYAAAYHAQEYVRLRRISRKAPTMA